MELKFYRGHIRNWRVLCEMLCIPATLDRREREQAIILASYKKWGPDMGQYLEGMFAFAIEDGDSLFLMRDHFGQKPLYYYVADNGQLLFSDQIRDILAMGAEKKLNLKMLQIYLTMTYTTGEETFFCGIKKLLPGRYMIYKNGKAEITRYWKPSFSPNEAPTCEEWADKIHNTLLTIMDEIKDADEYAESFLSGGVDSSYVLAVSDAPAGNSCGYDDSRLDESGLAAKTAEILNRGFNRCLITPDDYFAAVPYVMYNMEQPLGDASAVAFAIGCRSVAGHSGICYSGEGADEFFGGYNMYRNAPRYGDNLPTFYVGNTNIMKKEEKQKLLKKYYEDFEPIDLVADIYKEHEGLDPLSKMTAVDIEVWLEGDIYLNVDKMSRAAGLEVRMPLTDRRIFNIASQIPARFKVSEEQNKLALRAAASKVLPEEIAFRKKLGFVVPIRMWLSDARYNGDMLRLWNSPFADEFFVREELDFILSDYLSGNSDGWRKVYTIYAFLCWYEEYFIKR